MLDVKAIRIHTAKYSVRGLDLESKIYFVSTVMGRSIKPAALVAVSPPSIQFFVCRTYKVETRS